MSATAALAAALFGDGGHRNRQCRDAGEKQ
jgi:hypothetical protein